MRIHGRARLHVRIEGTPEEVDEAAGRLRRLDQGYEVVVQRLRSRGVLAVDISVRDAPGSTSWRGLEVALSALAPGLDCRLSESG